MGSGEMRQSRAPMFLVGPTSSVGELFAVAARASGIPGERVGELASILPDNVRSATAFYDRINKFWRYDFGCPITDLPADQAAIGTWMFPPLLGLPPLLDAAQSRLTPEQLRIYLARLDREESHEDMRAEFAPILRLELATRASYEVATGSDRPPFDWTIRPAGGPVITLEVKNRIRDLIESMARMATGEQGDDGTGPVPSHDAALLFRSVARKFPSTSPPLRGAWILTILAQPRRALHAAFDALAERLDFAFLHNWEDEVYLLTGPAIDREYLLRTFGVAHAERLVFDDPTS